MKSQTKSRSGYTHMQKQRGVVLFFALVALLAMSLAAVALIRSVDTGTLIAGNLALKQSATTSSDRGVEAAIVWLRGTSNASSAQDPLIDATHPFNISAPTSGYYANFDPALSLTDGTFAWDNSDSAPVDPDGSGNPRVDVSGNQVRYVIQRLCRTAGVSITNAECLFSGTIVDNSKQNIALPQEICNGPGCAAIGQTPQLRITVRTTGPRNTVSYVQAFVF